MKECGICNEEFEPKHFNSKNCNTDACKEIQRAKKRAYKNAWRESKKPPIEDKTCLHCGEVFTPEIRNNVKYCNITCTKEAHKEKSRQETKERQAKIPLRECKACKEMFKPSKDDPRNQLCRYECNNTWTKMKSKKATKERQKNITPRVCLTCNEKFMPNRYDVGSEQMQKYCDSKCLENHPMRKLRNNIQVQMRKSLKYLKQKKNNKAFTLLGYSKYELKNHFESKFTDGMSWDNMDKWHIDHIRPVASFNFTTTECEDFKKCFALENLQPLWAKDNLKKGAKELEV